MQEVSLFNAAYDGDVEGLNNALRIGVPVDFMYPVREYVIVSEFYLYKIVCSIGLHHLFACCLSMWYISTW